METTESYDYRIRTDFFEGPLDLLLHLVKKNKMEITQIRISDITAEYLSHLSDRSRINPSREGDFLMMASTLIYIKSRALLPKPEILAEEESPEERLINTLIEYDKIQKISYMLKEKEQYSIMLWKREEIHDNFENREFRLEEVSSFQLAEVFLNIVKRREREEYLYINSKNYSIEAKWNEILSLLEIHGYLDFTQYVESLESLENIVVSFFTILEMIKRRVIAGIQKEIFGPISLWKAQSIPEPVQ